MSGSLQGGGAAGVEHVRVRVRVGSTIDIDVRLDHAAELKVAGRLTATVHRAGAENDAVVAATLRRYVDAV